MRNTLEIQNSEFRILKRKLILKCKKIIKRNSELLSVLRIGTNVKFGYDFISEYGLSGLPRRPERTPRNDKKFLSHCERSVAVQKKNLNSSF